MNKNRQKLPHLSSITNNSRTVTQSIRTACIVFFLICALAICCIAALTAYFTFHDHAKQDTVVVIKRGSGISKIGKILEKAGLVRNWRIFSIISHIGYRTHRTLKAGEYMIYYGSNILDIFDQMCSGHVVRYNIAIPEGLTVYQIADLLEHTKQLARNLPMSHMIDEFPEGSLMPDTYSYTTGMEIADLMRTMQRKMRHFLELEWVKRDHSIDNVVKSIDDAVVLASIVEKEVFFRNEGAKIASVYINRLRLGMPLQACPTVIYGITKGEGSWHRRLRYSDLKHSSEHNTYVRKGLPPTAICNPGRDSILAVLHPAKTKYLYFVANTSKHHLFSQTYTTHSHYTSLMREQRKAASDIDNKPLGQIVNQATQQVN